MICTTTEARAIGPFLLPIEYGKVVAMVRDQLILDINHELIVDNFAGGGGASCGIELALGRHVDIAINHDPEAVAMHSVNHPQTEHHCESVWDVDPREVTKGRRVGLAWFSPDCKHFSKAKGGKPREKKIRGLAWVVMRWVATVRPRVIMLENVEEFRTWGPLLEDGQPCPKNKGRTFNSFINALKRHGYQVEHRELRACDYGAPTIRKRLFLIARCDGRPIVWPEPTHGAPDSIAVKSKKLKPWRTAAECIDWSITCPSIFERSKPLAEATQKRIARGIQRYVLDAAKPFIVTVAHGEGKPGAAQRWGAGVRSLETPLQTVTASGGYALASAFLAKHYGGNYTGPGVDLREPADTVTTVDHHALVAANLITYYGDKREGDFRGAGMAAPLATQTTENRHAVVASSMVKLRGSCRDGQTMEQPAPTVTAGGTHLAEVRAFLIKYYSEGGQDQACSDPMHTIPTHDRIGLVTVAGEQYAIADIGMRMLEPRELYRAQGFPDSYQINIRVIDHHRSWLKGETIYKDLPKSAQVRMVGNSVCPPLAAALAKANVPELAAWGHQDKRAKMAA